MSAGIYRGWASVYEAFESDAAHSTWRDGIVQDLRSLNCGASRILDLGAGTGIGGRTIMEAFPGSTVVALDQSKEMLEAGRVPAELAIVGDMARFEVPPGTFDFVVSGFDVFNYLDTERLASCFGCVAKALGPKGHLVFDYLPRHVVYREWGHLDVQRQHEGRELQVTHRHEPELDRNRIHLQLVAADRILWTETHFYHSIDPFTIHEIALSAGLSIVRIRDLGRETYSPGSGTHVYTLRRDGGSHAQ